MKLFRLLAEVYQGWHCFSYRFDRDMADTMKGTNSGLVKLGRRSVGNVTGDFKLVGLGRYWQLIPRKELEMAGQSLRCEMEVIYQTENFHHQTMNYLGDTY